VVSELLSSSRVLKIRRSENQGRAIFALSGRIEEKHVSELKGLLDADASATEVMLDLAEVKLVDREAIKFLAACETRGIGLMDCPSYIRRWIEQGGEA
jgi:hypothetical protein